MSRITDTNLTWLEPSSASLGDVPLPSLNFFGSEEEQVDKVHSDLQTSKSQMIYDSMILWHSIALSYVLLSFLAATQIIQRHGFQWDTHILKWDGAEMENSLCHVNRLVGQAPEQVQGSGVLLSGQGETQGQTVPLNVELLGITSSLLQQCSKASKPPEMHLHSQEHSSMSGQTWFNISVTHLTLCPSLQLKRAKHFA